MKKRLPFVIIGGLVAIILTITTLVCKHTMNKKNTVSNKIELEKEHQPKKDSIKKNVETASDNSKENKNPNKTSENPSENLSKNEVKKDSVKKSSDNTVIASNNNNKEQNKNVIKAITPSNSKPINSNSSTSNKKNIVTTKVINNNKVTSNKNHKPTRTSNIKGKCNTAQCKANIKKSNPVIKPSNNSVAKVKNNSVKKENNIKPKKENMPVSNTIDNKKNSDDAVQATDTNHKNNRAITTDTTTKKNETIATDNIAKKIKPITNNNVNSSKKTEPSLDEVQQAIFRIVNRERQKVGKAPLSYDKTMEKYAIIKSKDMITRNYFDHTDLEGKLITDKMNKDGVKYMAWGENIISRRGQINVNELAEHFMERWMNSPGHRANILSDKFKTIGVGLYKIGDAVYGTQEFCKY